MNKQQKIYDVALVGAGAAGLTAALACAQGGLKVALFEAQDRIGKTILVTGNGRCNVGNSNVNLSAYYHQDFVAQTFEVLSPSQAYDFLRYFGLSTLEESAGRLYPCTNKASSVVDLLRQGIELLGVEVYCNEAVVGLQAFTPPTKKSTSQHAAYELVTESGRHIRTRACCVAAGNKCGAHLLPQSLVVRPFEPRLLPLKTTTQFLKGMENVRLKGEIALLSQKDPSQVLHRERGEIQFRDYGISGVCAFNMSRRVRKGDKLSLNLLAHFSPQDLRDELARRTHIFASASHKDKLCGLVLPVVAENVLRCARLDPHEKLTPTQINRLVDILQHFPLTVTGFGPARQAQVHRGGVEISHICPTTCELRQFPGLYVIGEAVDVDADCGGFNLTWAWVSALVAAQAILGRPVLQA